VCNCATVRTVPARPDQFASSALREHQPVVEQREKYPGDTGVSEAICTAFLSAEERFIALREYTFMSMSNFNCVALVP
jgi:hypothetical protein